MQWEFTPEDVVRARADYRLEHFRRDLAEEVRMNSGGQDEVRQRSTFDLIYDLCYSLATGKDFEQFAAGFAFDPPTVEFLRELKPMMADNAAMLGAILQRMIMDRVEHGAPLEDALGDVATSHAQAAARRV